MAITKQKKSGILKDLEEQLKSSQLVIFVNFHGLGTAATRKLRKMMLSSTGRYQVAKKTLIRKALETLDVSGIMPNLQGEIGMIFSPAEKLTDIAKNLVKFLKEHKELTISGGMLENKFIGPKMVTELAAIPSREELLAKLAYVMKSSVQGLVVTLNGPARDFISVLSQISAKGGKK